MVITFLTDYGLEDEFVGVCHAVMAGIAPDVRVVDLTHGIPRHDVPTAALVLCRTLPYTPPGVHLAVVDPEVGGSRRAVALRCGQEDRILVGPDNGVLLPAADALGGVVEAVELSRSPHRLEPVSATFHGRDLFAPVAAHLAAGAPLAGAGDPLDPSELTRPYAAPAPIAERGGLVAVVRMADRFGNLTLNAAHADVTPLGLRVGRRLLVDEREAVYARTFADVELGEVLLYEDPYGSLAVAVRGDSAAERLGRAAEDELLLRPAP